MRPAALLVLLLIAHPAAAIVEPDNQGRWTKPTGIGPDKEVPGFLVNLGATGARAILRETSFVVKHVFAGSPADGELEIDDEITGANGKGFTKHTFGKFYGMGYEAGYEGPIMDLGNAIEDSEGRDGVLKLDATRAGKPVSVSIKLPAIGRFGDTYPLNCPKSAKLAADSTDYILNHKADHSHKVHEEGTLGLALLARGKMEEAGKQAMEWTALPDEKSWTWHPSYRCVFLCEYYLHRRQARSEDHRGTDAAALPRSSARSRALQGPVARRPQAKNFLKGGLGHGHRIAGYGTMTITTLLAMLSWELAEDCGIEVDQSHLDIAYGCIHEHTHRSGYMGYRFATGAYTPVGRQGLSIIVHQVAGDRDAADHVARVTGHLAKSRTRLNDGHGDNVQAVFWGLLGIQLSGDKAAIREMFDYNKAFINMARTHDGAFVVQPGRNAAEKAYYLSPRIHPTAAMVLVLGMSDPQLRIQGGAG